MISQLQNDYYELGKYFGYPDCCIHDFIRRINSLDGHEIKLTENQNNVHLHTGFVPCDKCSTYLLENNICISSLIRNRECEFEFPYEDETECINRKNIYPEFEKSKRYDTLHKLMFNNKSAIAKDKKKKYFKFMKSSIQWQKRNKNNHK